MTIRLAVRASTLALCTTLAASLALPAQASGIDSVHPKAETAPLFDDETGGNANADDPAIWRNTAAPGRSLVIATAKQGGLRVYDLDARQVQSIPAPAGPSADDKPGRFNNVDLVHGLRLGGTRADVAVVSDRGN
ncbi:phytase, partial [Streptomyces hydrogenans]